MSRTFNIPFIGKVRFAIGRVVVLQVNGPVLTRADIGAKIIRALGEPARRFERSE